MRGAVVKTFDKRQARHRGTLKRNSFCPGLKGAVTEIPFPKVAAN